MTLRIAILSRVLGAFSTQRLKEACQKRGHTVRVLNVLNFSLLVQTGRPELFYRDRPVEPLDAVIPRIGPSVTAYGTAVVRQFEQVGVFALNSAQAISASRDKFRALQLLSQQKVGIPPTALVRARDGVNAAIHRVGGAPLIIKLVEGSQGDGVILADTNKRAEAILETLLLAGQTVIVQRFVTESSGRDYRAFVVGNRVIAAMERRAAPDEYRSNIHRGGRAVSAQLSPELEATAVRATQLLGLRVAGVDLIESEEGPMVLEVNSSPGLEGIESATGVEVAEQVVLHLEEQVRFPDFDIRPRLSGAGYDVLELSVTEESGACWHAIRELGLEGPELRVLSVGRALQIVPNPPGEFLILPGDRLLCFGRIEALRQLLYSHSGRGAALRVVEDPAAENGLGSVSRTKA